MKRTHSNSSEIIPRAGTRGCEPSKCFCTAQELPWSDVTAHKMRGKPSNQSNDRGLIFRVHRDSKQLNNKTPNHLMTIWTNAFIQFFKEEIKMRTSVWKNYSTASVIRERQAEASVRLHRPQSEWPSPGEMVASTGRGCGPMKPFPASGDGNPCTHCRKQHGCCTSPMEQAFSFGPQSAPKP